MSRKAALTGEGDQKHVSGSAYCGRPRSAVAQPMPFASNLSPSTLVRFFLACLSHSIRENP